MSASLVGSEMCIRDRYTRAYAPLISRSSDQDGQARPDERTGATHTTMRCLLYTSDAADDM
eukprot:7644049-Alexandrium_andersonii.AAC.1